MKTAPITDEDLMASGCTKEQIAQFSACTCTQDKLRFLSRHRRALLEEVHERERQISTLDYLAGQLERSGK